MIYTYLAKSKIGYKIGQSKNPENRIKQLKTASPDIRLICFGIGKTEKELHNKYTKQKIKLEWYKLQRIDVENIIRFLNNEYTPKTISKNEDRKLNYIIPFGKYKGFKICEMTNREELNYIKWFLKNIPNKKNSLIHKMFKFWERQII